MDSWGGRTNNNGNRRSNEGTIKPGYNGRWSGGRKVKITRFLVRYQDITLKATTKPRLSISRS